MLYKALELPSDFGRPPFTNHLIYVHLFPLRIIESNMPLSLLVKPSIVVSYEEEYEGFYARAVNNDDDTPHFHHGLTVAFKAEIVFGLNRIAPTLKNVRKLAKCHTLRSAVHADPAYK